MSGPKVAELLLVGRGRCAKRLSRAFGSCSDEEVIFEIYEGSHSSLERLKSLLLQLNFSL
mgnify:CR=1 FL=1